MNDLGKNFRKLRELAGLSQEALAGALKISTSVVNRIENNKRKLDIELVFKLQDILHIDLCTIIMAISDKRNEEVPLMGNGLSAHYEKIIEEKNKIIEEKNQCIALFEQIMR